MKKIALFFLLFVAGSLNSLDAQQAQKGGSSLFGLLLPLLLLFAIFYFLLILPQQRQEKKRKEMLSKIRKGDRVVTSGGLIGTIQKVDENVVTLKISQNTNVKVERGSIKGIIGAVEGGSTK